MPQNQKSPEESTTRQQQKQRHDKDKPQHKSLSWQKISPKQKTILFF
jgi:hypothetical protein